MVGEGGIEWWGVWLRSCEVGCDRVVVRVDWIDCLGRVGLSRSGGGWDQVVGLDVVECWGLVGLRSCGCEVFKVLIKF